MLSAYHRMFLRRLNLTSIRYLIVGGQARRGCAGKAGYDVDLWVELTTESRIELVHLLQKWIQDHPLHVRAGTADALEHQLRDGVQLKFPEFEQCGYFDGTESGFVNPSSGVDILVGGQLEPSFDTCYERSLETIVDGNVVRCLNPADDALLPPLPKEFARF